MFTFVTLSYRVRFCFWIPVRIWRRCLAVDFQEPTWNTAAQNFCRNFVTSLVLQRESWLNSTGVSTGCVYSALIACRRNKLFVHVTPIMNFPWLFSFCFPGRTSFQLTTATTIPANIRPSLVEEYSWKFTFRYQRQYSLDRPKSCECFVVQSNVHWLGSVTRRCNSCLSSANSGMPLAWWRT